MSFFLKYLLGLDEAVIQYKRSADRLKKLAISGLENIDNQLSGCVTWDQLEKYV